MKTSIRIWVIAALLFLPANLGWAGAQTDWRVLYDETQTVTPPRASAQERALIGRAAALQKDGACAGGERLPTPQLIGRAPGPFLKAQTQETALVYQTCTLFTADTLGLIITRAGRPALHVAFRGSAISEIYSVLDVNRDGLRELVMLENFADAGSGQRWLNVWDFRRAATGGLPTTPYRFLTAKETCEPAEARNTGVLRHYRVWVRPGRPPAFRANEFGTDRCVHSPLSRLRTGITPPRPTAEAPVPVQLPLP